MKMKKDKGAIEYSMSIILLMISVLLILFCFRIRSARVEKMYLEDGMASANLAAAVIDTDIYGETEKLNISDTSGAYERFKKSLKTNLNLDDHYMPENTFLMENPVKILEFRVYNVDDDMVTCVVYDEHGSRSTESSSLSHTVTPDGTEVESTTIYSKIEFDVKGFLDQRNRLTLENSVDVVKN